MVLVKEMWALEWKDENLELTAAAKAVWGPSPQLASLNTRQVRAPGSSEHSLLMGVVCDASTASFLPFQGTLLPRLTLNDKHIFHYQTLNLMVVKA